MLQGLYEHRRVPERRAGLVSEGIGCVVQRAVFAWRAQHGYHLQLASNPGCRQTRTLCATLAPNQTVGSDRDQHEHLIALHHGGGVAPADGSAVRLRTRSVHGVVFTQNMCCDGGDSPVPRATPIARLRGTEVLSCPDLTAARPLRPAHHGTVCDSVSVQIEG